MLGEPDNQTMSDEADAYHELLDPMKPWVIADASAQGSELVTFHDFQVEMRPTPGEGPVRVLDIGLMVASSEGATGSTSNGRG